MQIFLNDLNSQPSKETKKLLLTLIRPVAEQIQRESVKSNERKGA